MKVKQKSPYEVEALLFFVDRIRDYHKQNDNRSILQNSKQKKKK